LYLLLNKLVNQKLNQIQFIILILLTKLISKSHGMRSKYMFESFISNDYKKLWIKWWCLLLMSILCVCNDIKWYYIMNNNMLYKWDNSFIIDLIDNIVYLKFSCLFVPSQILYMKYWCSIVHHLIIITNGASILVNEIHIHDLQLDENMFWPW